MGYTITKSGISDFYLSIHYGKVAPKKEKKGIFEWVANAFLFIGPFFIPATMLLICIYFLTTDAFNVITPTYFIDLKYTFAGQINIFGASLYDFSSTFFTLLFNINLFHPGHFGFILLLIFLGMGIRPSYIGEKKQRKVDMIYDLHNIWSLITHKPIYILILFSMSYLFFYISLSLNTNWYVALFSIFGWLSIIAIVSLILADIILLFIKITDELPGRWRLIPFLSMPLLYTIFRIPFYLLKIKIPLSIPLILTILSTILITYVLLVKKTNKFKTKNHIKLFKKKKKKDEKDE